MRWLQSGLIFHSFEIFLENPNNPGKCFEKLIVSIMKITLLCRCKFQFVIKIPIATPYLFKFGPWKTIFSKSFLNIADGAKSPKQIFSAFENGKQ